MTDNRKQAAIAECRSAFAGLLAAMDAFAAAKRQYDALDLGNNVADGDFSDGLLATEFVAGVTSMGNMETELAAGNNTNLYRAAL